MKVPPWMRSHWRELVLGAVLLSPWVAVLVLGFLWLHDHDGVLYWVSGTAFLGAATWPLRRSMRRQDEARARADIGRMGAASPDWGANSQAAWDKVSALAAATPPLSFTDTDAARDVAEATVRLVARHFHPDSARPEANITLPEALLLAEQVARDLRAGLLASVPGARSIKLGWLLAGGDLAGKYGKRAMQLYELANHGYNFWQLASNPVTGAARLIKGETHSSTSALIVERLRGYGTRRLVLETGRAAIDLYSGKLRLSPGETADASRAETKVEAAPSPPRILLAGQVNAGKSSLLNALAGEVLCQVRTTPTPARAVEHSLVVDGAECAVVIDMPGLAPGDDPAAALGEAAGRADMIVWVASALQAGRAIDVAALAVLRGVHAADLARRPPPVLVVLTHVDQLSPAAEWAPPYDLKTPQRPKELTMQRAMAAVARTLGLPESAVLPVALRGGEAWNVDQAWAGIAALLGEAKYRQLERLRLAHSGSSVAGVARQAARLAGHVVTAVLD